MESPISEVFAESVEAPIFGKKFVDPTMEDEKLFIEDFTAMMEENELKVNLEPVICGRKISLFKLWQVVNLEEFGGSHEVEGRKRWAKIAEKLNFNVFRHVDAPVALRAVYEEVLRDYEAMRDEFMQNEEYEELLELQPRATADRESISDDPSDKEADELGEEEVEEDYDDDLEAPASMPRQPNMLSKRSFDTDGWIEQDGSPELGSFSKRRLIGKGRGKEREIPSTPEDVVNVNPTSRSAYQSSPLKHRQNADEDGNRSPTELFSGRMKNKNPPTHRRVRRNVEPETQDFNFHFPSTEDNEKASQDSLPAFQSRSKTRASQSSPQEEPPTQSQTASRMDDLLSAFIDQWLSRGYGQDVIIQALESTSMTTGNAAIVMEELSQGHGIPENVQGVWTALDDAALENMESEAFERVAMKHGPKFITLRQKFLAHQKEARGELEEE